MAERPDHAERMAAWASARHHRELSALRDLYATLRRLGVYGTRWPTLDAAMDAVEEARG